MSAAGIMDALKQRARREEDATIQNYLSALLAAVPKVQATSSTTSAYQ